MDGAGGSKCWLCWLGRGRVVPTAAAGKSKDGQTSKSERLLSDAATPTEKLKHTSVLTRSVLWFGDRCHPFGLKIGDTDQH